ncbi:hypothetical protein B0H13DRAFT_1879854 [Mycena leptocephala]|nr:hypothetical protein B0H13DRAFT_1879854 [Mycena leptocephala]
MSSSHLCAPKPFDFCSSVTDIPQPSHWSCIEDLTEPPSTATLPEPRNPVMQGIFPRTKGAGQHPNKCVRRMPLWCMEESCNAWKMIEVMDLQLVYLERNRKVAATGLVQNQKATSGIKDAVQWRNKLVQMYEDAQTALQYLNDMNLWCQFAVNLQKRALSGSAPVPPVVFNMWPHDYRLPCINSYDISCQYAFNLQERPTPRLTLAPSVLADDAPDDDDVPDLEEVEPSDGEQA